MGLHLLRETFLCLILQPSRLVFKQRSAAALSWWLFFSLFPVAPPLYLVFTVPNNNDNKRKCKRKKSPGVFWKMPRYLYKPSSSLARAANRDWAPFLARKNPLCPF